MALGGPSPEVFDTETSCGNSPSRNYKIYEAKLLQIGIYLLAPNSNLRYTAWRFAKDERNPAKSDFPPCLVLLLHQCWQLLKEEGDISLRTALKISLMDVLMHICRYLLGLFCDCSFPVPHQCHFQETEYLLASRSKAQLSYDTWSISNGFREGHDGPP